MVEISGTDSGEPPEIGRLWARPASSVGQELLQPLISEGASMPSITLKVRSPRQHNEGALDKCMGADRCSQDLGLVAIVVVHRSDLLNQIHTVLADVIESPNERADQERGLGGQALQVEAQGQTVRTRGSTSCCTPGCHRWCMEFDHDLLTNLEKRFCF